MKPRPGPHAGLLLLCALAPLTGCWCGPPVPEAPGDVDGLFHWLWRHGDVADEPSLENAVALLDAQLDAGVVAASDPLRGALTDLTREELANVGLENGEDPRRGRGTYLVDVIACSREKLEQLFVSADQATLYPESWDGYARTYSLDPNDFLAGKSQRTGWDNEVHGHILSANYVELQRGELRRVREKDAPVRLLSRTWMKQPATFEGTGTRYPQNAQVEVFYERAGGEVVHLYAMWREVRIDVLGLSTDDDVIINAMVDTLVKWDGRTAELCAMP